MGVLKELVWTHPHRQKAGTRILDTYTCTYILALLPSSTNGCQAGSAPWLLGESHEPNSIQVPNFHKSIEFYPTS